LRKNKRTWIKKKFRCCTIYQFGDKWIEWRLGHLDCGSRRAKVWPRKNEVMVESIIWELGADPSLLPCIWSLGFIILFIIGRMYNCIMEYVAVSYRSMNIFAFPIFYPTSLFLYIHLHYVWVHVVFNQVSETLGGLQSTKSLPYALIQFDIFIFSF